MILSTDYQPSDSNPESGSDAAVWYDERRNKFVTERSIITESLRILSRFVIVVLSSYI